MSSFGACRSGKHKMHAAKTQTEPQAKSAAAGEHPAVLQMRSLKNLGSLRDRNTSCGM